MFLPISIIILMTSFDKLFVSFLSPEHYLSILCTREDSFRVWFKYICLLGKLWTISTLNHARARVPTCMSEKNK